MPLFFGPKKDPPLIRPDDKNLAIAQIRHI